ncbi:MAG: hypothetical protein PF549_03155, partial [Patescibacteria group bacterium]|nr:hypothetical protein [Patescibacteria group bacterium]
DSQANQVDEVVSFAKENNLSGDELDFAYQMALGVVSPEDIQSKNPSEKVFALAKKMDEFMQDGLAVNKIIKIIETKKEFEGAVNTYYDLVDIMKVGEKEKKVLRSIMDNQRSGTLMIVEPKTMREIDGIKIPEELKDEKYAKNSLAVILVSRLAQYKDKEIGITFSE